MAHGAPRNSGGNEATVMVGQLLASLGVRWKHTDIENEPTGNQMTVTDGPSRQQRRGAPLQGSVQVKSSLLFIVQGWIGVCWHCEGHIRLNPIQMIQKCLHVLGGVNLQSSMHTQRSGTVALLPMALLWIGSNDSVTRHRQLGNTARNGVGSRDFLRSPVTLHDTSADGRGSHGVFVHGVISFLVCARL